MAPQNPHAERIPDGIQSVIFVIVYTTFNVLKLVSSLSNSTLGYLLYIQRNQILEFMCLYVSCSVVIVNYNFTNFSMAFSKFYLIIFLLNWKP